MTSTGHISDRLKVLVDTACTDRLSEAESNELELLLRDNAAGRQYYAAYCQMHSELLFITAGARVAQAARAAVRTPPQHSPRFGYVGQATHGLTTFFSGEVPFACLVATVVMAVGIFILSLIPKWHPDPATGDRGSIGSAARYDRNDRDDDRSESDAASPLDDMEFVGQITGMVDCKWSNPQTEAYNGAGVPLGRKYALSSGLMQITYDTGAKVILQGPCSYEVESKAGGYLSLGKLTARVEKGPRPKAQGPGTAASRPQPLAPSPSSNPSLSTLHSPLFTIKTPTATVTDLGTEFGVEVEERGDCDLQVFDGMVKLRQFSSEGADTPPDIQVVAGQSVQVNAATKVVSHTIAEPARFVRSINTYLASKVISVNFTCADKVNLAPEERTGVLMAPNWNNMDASVNPAPATELHNAAGIATSARVTWQWNGNPTTPAGCNYEYAKSPRISREKLISGRFDGHAGDAPTLTLSVTNIPFSKYKAYVYYWLVPSPDEGQNQSFGLSVNGSSPIVIVRSLYDLGGFCRYRSPEQPSDYQVFESLSGDLIVKTTRDGKGPFYTQPIVGLQIVENPARGK